MASKSSRRGLKTLLGMVVRKAICEGIIPSPPDIIHLAAHFSRADLSTLRDFAKLKRRFSAVRRTYATTMKPLVLRIPTDQGTARVSVRLVDTMLIAPAGASLASLGATLGVPKVDLPHGYSKARMDVFKQQKTRGIRTLRASSTPRSQRAGPLAFFRWYGPKWACRDPFPHLAVSASR